VDGRPPAADARVVGPTDLRRVAGQFATGVTVITMRDGDGVRGMTANSFTSLSLEPPLVMVSVDTRKRTHRLLADVDTRFAVSILGESHREWADYFAGRRGDVQHIFDEVPHWLTEDGLPVIDNSIGWLIARVTAIYPAGDHSIFVGEVEELATGASEPGLLFFRAGYHRLERP
jgi:flavin reductase (DIM6/NTAB) family NADH-FMN oxidoreductase RutF